MTTTTSMVYLPQTLVLCEFRHDGFEEYVPSGPSDSGLVSKWRPRDRVYQQSIAVICIQDWPKEKMLVQILDDSDDTDVQSLIKAEVQKWQQRGVHII